MKTRKIIIYFYLVFIIIFFIIDNIYDYLPHTFLIEFIEINKFLYPLIFSFLLLPFLLWIINSYYNNKLNIEKNILFEATIHSMQDLLHNQLSTLQLIKLELEDEDINKDVIKEIDDSLSETTTLINKISDIDLTKIKLKELKENFSVLQFKE